MDVKNIIPKYYQQTPEHCKRFALQMVNRYRESIARLTARGMADGYSMKHHRAKLQMWRDIAGNPSAFINL